MVNTFFLNWLTYSSLGIRGYRKVHGGAEGDGADRLTPPYRII